MEWIAIGVSILINLIIVSYGYGKLTSRSESNKAMIELLDENCKLFRGTCHVDSEKINTDVSRKLEELKNSMTEGFLKLSIQVAKLEKSNNE